MSETDTLTPQTRLLSESERWRQTRIKRLLKELNATSTMKAAISLQIEAILEELRDLGHPVKSAGKV